MKINVTKFNKLREKSKELSKKRDYRLISHIDGRDNLKEISSDINIRMNNFNCEYMGVGCTLHVYKRVMDKCKECPLNKD